MRPSLNEALRQRHRKPLCRRLGYRLVFVGVPEFSFFTIWSVEEAYAANTRSFIMEATATKKLSLCLAFLTLGREGLMVRNFPLWELAVERKRLKILSRHTGENQPI